MLFQLRHGDKRIAVMIFPDIFTIHNARKKYLILWKVLFSNKLKGLFSLNKIKTNSVKVKSAHLAVAVTDITEICLEQDFDTVFGGKYLFIKRNKKGYILCGKIGHKIRLIKFRPLCTKLRKLCKIIAVSGGNPHRQSLQCPYFP